MKHLQILLLATTLIVCPTQCFGQASWMDFSSAIPRALSPMGTPNFNMGSQGYPSTSGFSSTSTPMLNTNSGFNNAGFGGAGPMYSPALKDWKLGVFVENRPEGALITQVAPGSAGEASGLQSGDVIVAVSASRIGIVDNRIIELADEIRRNADSLGRVSLLVFSARQRTLVALPVSMNSTSKTLSGVVATRDRQQLPLGSALVVQLQNITNPYLVIEGGRSVTRAEGYGPYNFELNFDPRYIAPRDQYQLTAAITLGNQTIYGLPQPISINPNAIGQSLSLLLEPVIGGSNYPSLGQGNIVNVGYPGTNLTISELNNLFLQLLNRAPTAAEAIAWQSYLQQGNSINDLKIKLMSNIKFREKFVNDGAYVQQLIMSLAGRAPDQQEVAFWTTRLQTTQSPETVIGEILQRNR